MSCLKEIAKNCFFFKMDHGYIFLFFAFHSSENERCGGADDDDDNESVVSDYSEIGDAFKEHLTTSFSEGELKLIAKHELTSGDFRLNLGDSSAPPRTTHSGSVAATSSTIIGGGGSALISQDTGIFAPDEGKGLTDEDDTVRCKWRHQMQGLVMELYASFRFDIIIRLSTRWV